jgi:hypothetical protein
VATRFPFVAVASGRGDTSLMPLLPIALSIKGGNPVQAQGLLDSGATVNVLPYTVGVALGAVWDEQKTRVMLSGNLAAQESRALLLQAKVADFDAVPLVFAWTQADNIPLLLGQVNFFDQFDVCFHRYRRQFEIAPASK